jgi:gamma-glutamyltranspeptidase/glutathione hydrolase
VTVQADTWTLSKPAVRSRKGIVVSQHREASAAGAEILEQGGNAVDAAVATAFALGVVEPWMSGIGGGGFLVTASVEGEVSVIDFGLISPKRLQVSRFEVENSPTESGTLFGWPRVIDDRNLLGFESISIPGAVDGLGVAVERFGKLRLADVIEPAIRLASRGLIVDWHTTLLIGATARELSLNDAARAMFLPKGFPPVTEDDDTPERLPSKALAETYRRIAKHGYRDFYEGQLARDILSDLPPPCAIRDDDLSNFHSQVSQPDLFMLDGYGIWAPGDLSGGPTLRDCLAAIAIRLRNNDVTEPGTKVLDIFGETLIAGFEQRLSTLGHAAGSGNTSHVSVVDADGNMAALTNTLLSRFGSKVVLPTTGILMNNGLMWFDPRPGRPNSLAPGVRPLSNMCPVIATKGGFPVFALGACGGRRIITAVTQLTSYMTSLGLPPEMAFQMPRLDFASDGSLTLRVSAPTDAACSLTRRLRADVPFPNRFAIPSLVARDWVEQMNLGLAHIASPVAAAVCQN